MARKPKQPVEEIQELPADLVPLPLEDADSLGRPPSYKPEYAAQAEKLCELGATDIEIGDFFGVSSRTVLRWKIQYENFCRALKTGKSVADERVERSLYHRANGYTFEAEKIFQFQGSIVRAKTLEHVPPDTTACIFWLKNRRKDLWRDVHKHEVGGAGAFDGKSDQEVFEAFKREAADLGIPLDDEGTKH